MSADSTKQPNRYELSGGKLHIAYSTTSFVGSPQFTYRDGTENRQFTGDEIRTAKSELGTLVTVDLRVIPDKETVTFTLVIPHVNLPVSTSADVSTIGITTVHETTIAGPPEGQTDRYTVYPLQGTASFVLF